VGRFMSDHSNDISIHGYETKKREWWVLREHELEDTIGSLTEENERAWKAVSENQARYSTLLNEATQRAIEAEQRAARYEEALRYIADAPPNADWYCPTTAREALSPIDPPLAQRAKDA
jgi:hypothetical protein